MKNAVLLCLLTACLAAAKPNFSGNWKMNAQKSNFGPLSANAPAQIVRDIQHTDPKLHFKTVQSGNQVEVTTEMDYTTDGKPALNTLRGTEIRGNAKWVGDALLIETKRTSQGVEVSQSDQWTMEDGGKFLKVESSITSPKGSFQFVVVFEKQQPGEKTAK